MFKCCMAISSQNCNVSHGNVSHANLCNFFENKSHVKNENICMLLGNIQLLCSIKYSSLSLLCWRQF